MEKKWYAAHVMTGQEDKVRRNIERRVSAMNLEEKIGRVVIPKERSRRYRSGRVQHVEHRLFPGYLLIEMVMEDDTWHFIQGTSGITGFVGSQSPPIPLQDNEVEALLKIVGEDTPTEASIWQKGESVRVRSGPFAEATGRIEEVNSQKQTLEVLISMFGRETPVELDFSQVDRL